MSLLLLLTHSPVKKALTATLSVTTSSGGGSAPAFEAATETTLAASSTWVVNAPASIASGELLVAVLAQGFTPGTVTPPGGWTASVTASNDPYLQSFWKIAGGSEPSTYTFTVGNGRAGTAVISRFSGADSTTPINVTTSAQQNGLVANPFVLPDVSPTVANTLYYAALSIDENALTVDWSAAPAGATSRYNYSANNNVRQQGYTESIAASGATGTRSWTINNTNRPRAGLALLIAPATTSMFHRLVNRSVPAALSFTGSVPKLLTRALTGAVLSFTGAVSTRSGLLTKVFTAVLTTSGDKSTKTFRPVTADLSFTGSIPKMLARASGAALSFTGSAARQTSRALTGAGSFLGALTKRAGKVQTGALSFTGAIPTRAITHVFPASLSFAGATGRSIRHGLSAALSFSGSTVRVTIKVFSGALSFTGTVKKTALKAQASTLSFVGTSTKTVLKAQAGVLSFVGTSARSTGRRMTATLSFAGVAQRRVTHVLSASQSLSAAVVRSIGTVKGVAVSTTSTLIQGAGHFLSMSATVTVTATRSIVIGLTRAAVQAVTARVSRASTKAISTTLAVVGATTKNVGIRRSATQDSATILLQSRAALRTLAAAVSTNASLGKSLGLLRATNVATVAVARRAINVAYRTTGIVTGAVLTKSASLLRLATNTVAPTLNRGGIALTLLVVEAVQATHRRVVTRALLTLVTVNIVLTKQAPRLLATTQEQTVAMRQTVTKVLSEVQELVTSSALQVGRTLSISLAPAASLSRMPNKALQAGIATVGLCRRAGQVALALAQTQLASVGQNITILRFATNAAIARVNKISTATLVASVASIVTRSLTGNISLRPTGDTVATVGRLPMKVLQPVVATVANLARGATVLQIFGRLAVFPRRIVNQVFRKKETAFEARQADERVQLLSLQTQDVAEVVDERFVAQETPVGVALSGGIAIPLRIDGRRLVIRPVDDEASHLFLTSTTTELEIEDRSVTTAVFVRSSEG